MCYILCIISLVLHSKVLYYRACCPSAFALVCSPGTKKQINKSIYTTFFMLYMVMLLYICPLVRLSVYRRFIAALFSDLPIKEGCFLSFSLVFLCSVQICPILPFLSFRYRFILPTQETALNGQNMKSLYCYCLRSALGSGF